MTGHYVATGCPGDLAFGTPRNQQTLALSLAAQAQRRLDNVPSADFFWAPAGSTVSLVGAQQVLYIANLLPSTVLSVKSYRNFDDGPVLVTVPAQFYQVRHTNYGAYLCTEIVFSIPLSQRGPGWTDDIYVTQTSSVGPNTADILAWLIEEYTTYSVDPVSFAHVGNAIDNYPMHFPILERKNILQTLEEIAFQARCAIFLRDDVFYLTYLSEQPTPVDTITADDIEAKSLQVTHTPTEDLVTRFASTWRSNYALSEPDIIIQRYNVSKYGLHNLAQSVSTTESYDFYCFNIQQLVEKSTTFWLIRKANVWRKIKFKTSLRLLNVETYDCVTVNLPYFSPEPIPCIVERADYDSASNRIEMELWTPVLSGTQVPYDFAFPATVPERAFFPLLSALRAGWAGAGFSPGFKTAAPVNHPLSASNSSLVQGANLTEGCLGDTSNYAEIGCRPDFGDRYPSDRGDQKPSPNAVADRGAIDQGQDPTDLSKLGIESELQALRDALSNAQATAIQALETANAANEAAKGAGSSGTGSQTDSESNKTLANLPTRKQLEDQMNKAGKADQIKCLASVTVCWFPVTETPPLITGIVVCIPAGPPVCETFTFNSNDAARNFARSAEAQGQALFAAHDSSCNPDFQVSSIIPNDASCQQGDGSIVAYDRTQNGIPTTGKSITDPGFRNTV